MASQGEPKVEPTSHIRRTEAMACADQQDMAKHPLPSFLGTARLIVLRDRSPDMQKAPLTLIVRAPPVPRTTILAKCPLYTFPSQSSCRPCRLGWYKQGRRFNEASHNLNPGSATSEAAKDPLRSCEGNRH